METDVDECAIAICTEGCQEKLYGVTRDGLLSLIEYAKHCKPERLTFFEGHLPTNAETAIPLKIHRSCQKTASNHLRKRKAAIANENTAQKPKKVTRLSVPKFDWKENCFFCTKPCNDGASDAKHPDRADMSRCEYKEFRDTVLQKCQGMDDVEAREIERRVLSCSDFVAAEARYHERCRDLFNLKANLNTAHTERGRPIPEITKKAFDDLCDWLEREGELHTLIELEDKLKELSQSNDVYSTKTIQRKLIEKYGANICISEVKGRRNVVCLKNIASVLLNDMWYQSRKTDFREESERIIKMAAKLIVSDIRDTEYETEFYPTNDTIKNCDENLNWLSPKLRLFMETCIHSKLKQASIGQCITHAVRPRGTLPPILFGHAVELDHEFGSRWVIDEESKLGYCLSYNEVTRFKQSVIMNETADDWLKRNMKGAFHHWIGDNVDHNSRTMDGKGTLHAMGIIVTTTGARGSNRDLPKIPRQKLMRVTELIKNKGVPLKSYIPPDISGMSKVVLKPLSELTVSFASPHTEKINLLWHTAYFFKRCRPGWSGYMSDVSVGPHNGKADFTMLPIIDMDPNDMSCIYSTLMFIQSQAEKLDVETPCVTFDQPLWMKGMEIVKAKSLQMVLILGGFHTMMSFAGSIGHLMGGSGLEDCLQTVYGSSAVPKMLEGKAIARALRAHFLTEASLTSILLSSFIPVAASVDDTQHSAEEISVEDDQEQDIDSEEEVWEEDMEDEPFEQCDALVDLESNELRQLEEEEVNELKDIYECLEKNYEEGMRRLNSSSTFMLVSDMLESLKEELRSYSRTSKLWLNYMAYVDILKQFVRAERCGDWELHLNAVEKMLNLFAATGHLNYAKSARLYLQEMRELKEKHPFVYQCFKEKGFHTVRRSDKFWAGLWTDLTIEQVLMRSIKSRGGITRGRGISESVRLVWLGSMHRRASVHDAMSSLTTVNRVSSEQHVELGATRKQRDQKDMSSFMLWLQSHNPFDTTSKELRSISCGLTANEGDKINCDDAETVGRKLQEKLDGVCFENVSMKRSEKIRTLVHLKDAVKVDNEKIAIDPLVLFARLSLLNQNQENAAAQFIYELSQEPPALYKNGLMRKATKSTLRQHLVKKAPNATEQCEFTVLDGGALLYQVQWFPHSTYNDIAEQYTKYILGKYGNGEDISVIFDGYDDPLSTKAHEHVRRSGLCSADVVVGDASMKVTTSRKLFLKNTNNKKELIKILSSRFTKMNIATTQSKGDADVLTVKTAIDAAHSKKVCVVSDDTDILVLLMYHWHSTMKDISFSTTKTVNKKKIPMKYSIRSLVNDHELTKYLLFAHAWTGCDTTSAIHKQGKTKILQHLKNKQQQSAISCFGDVFATEETIGKAGVNLFIKRLVSVHVSFSWFCQLVCAPVN